MLIDISKAHLYSPIEGEQYVDLAPERAKAGKCAKLLYTLYGLRTAASSWEREYSQTLEAEGFVPGIASKCTFFHPARTIRIVVHGDDFVIEGGQEDLDSTKGVLANKYWVKVRSILGSSGMTTSSGGRPIRGMSRRCWRTSGWRTVSRERCPEPSRRRRRTASWNSIRRPLGCTGPSSPGVTSLLRTGRTYGTRSRSCAAR